MGKSVLALETEELAKSEVRTSCLVPRASRKLAAVCAVSYNEGLGEYK
ncbi:hypothetical protein UF75_1065 [Desulfosporosinus sp. I2]|nr:hypothetical protein UF75_1065 [Desulfosporosinus sp. I2]